MHHFEDTQVRFGSQYSNMIKKKTRNLHIEKQDDMVTGMEICTYILQDLEFWQ